MPELRQNQTRDFGRMHRAPDGRPASAPERELLSFIDSVAKLIGLDQLTF